MPAERTDISRTYFQLAYTTIEHNLVDENIEGAVCYLTNLAEVCIHLGDAGVPEKRWRIVMHCVMTECTALSGQRAAGVLIMP